MWTDRDQGDRSIHCRWNFTNQCNAQCHCGDIVQFDPVCDGSVTYFSPCHAGCVYDTITQLVSFLRPSGAPSKPRDPGVEGVLFHATFQWSHCRCTNPVPYVTRGYCNPGCNTLPIYLSIMFVGFFIGNLFFMTTMMIVLRYGWQFYSISFFRVEPLQECPR